MPTPTKRLRRQHSARVARDQLGTEHSTQVALTGSADRPASIRGAPDTVLALQRSHGNAWVSRQFAQAPRSPAVASSTSAGLARQPFGLGRPTSIPPELLRPADLRLLSDKELTERHDAIAKLLAQFRSCPVDPKDDFWALTSEAKRAGTELARRAALQAGRTFSDDEVKAARDAFEANALKAPKDEGGDRKECIVILNDVLKDIWKDPSQKHTNDTIEKTMALFQAGGRAGAERKIWFTNRRGKVTKGGARPEGIQESVWQAVVEMVSGDPGWSVFGMSIMDGYHAVTLTLDNNDPANPKVFWSDQVPGWSDGWKEYGEDALTQRILGMVQSWWDGMAAGKKHTTVIRLWRLRRTPEGQPRP